MARRLPTGISVLDRQLDGGIPPGSILLLSADPASQSESLLYEIAAARGTLYVTTIRSEQAVRDAIDRYGGSVDRLSVRDAGDYPPIDNATRLVKDVPENANLLIDVVDPLEDAEPTRYRRFLNELQTHMVNTGSIAVLHAMHGESSPNRALTEHMADVVFDLRTDTSGSQIVNRLAVPKFRGGSALEETIKLKLTDGVTIDTSRDIA
ncbi:transcriptional regulator [Haloplanus rallus]|jgi:KaiC/GvpD/RAD55 family RecA-like ATPase|uniref:Transcriptional regulator n=1 Tax=Haloplanus rallus TaxID=1816183 RepID=A0A6B9F7M9_9EURY|nr:MULTISPECIES: transcriptional regulator [Haloplanus]QGX94427.1 transcriptional regulator [Haloplanus rallus]